MRQALICLLIYFRHFEGRGEGAAVFFLAQGLPLHHAVLDGFNLPPLAVLLVAFTSVLPLFINYPKIGDKYSENSMIIAIFADRIK